MKFLIFICVICFMLAFTGSPGSDSPRSFLLAWNFGHILLFSLLAYLLLSLSVKISRKPFLKQICWIFIIALLLGFAIEMVQFVLDSGTPDLGDIFRNFIGCLFAFAFLAPSRNMLPKRNLRLLQVFTVLVILIEIFPLAKALIDEGIGRKQFPVLADFETPFEWDRWTGVDKSSIDHETARHGKSSLIIRLTTARYSGAGLKYFPGDWRGYSFLQFSVFNPSSNPLNVVCRVHDSLHSENGWKYDDRFNRSFVAEPGWNDISIPIEKIVNAPKNRKMEISKIRGFGIFTVRLLKPQTINMDYMKLAK